MIGNSFPFAVLAFICIRPPLSRSYTIVCPLVRVNQRALASGLFLDHGKTFLNHAHQLIVQEILRSRVKDKARVV